MVRRSFTVFTLLLAALWAPLTSRAGGETPVNSYTVVDLTQNSGLATAYDVNDAGQVVGRAYGSEGEGGWARAHLWQDGVLTDLGTLGGSLSDAYAINNSRQVVGFSWTSTGDSHAFIWDAVTGMRDLGTLGGRWSSACDINDAGQVVGGATNPAGTKRAFLWQAGRMYDLGVPGGYVSSEARGINAAGQVTGYVTDANGANRAFRWIPTVPNGTAGTMIALEPVTGSSGQGINGAGTVVGTVALRPTLWDGTGAQALPLLPGGTEGVATAINDSRRVVGYNVVGDDAGGTVFAAYLWDGANGTRDLTAMAGQPAPWPLASAGAINASGQIVANVEDYAAYLLTPSPLPSRPLSLQASAGSTGVSLSWVASYGADHYQVKRASTSGGPYSSIASVTGTTYKDSAVVNGDAYYVVTAVNGYGESAPSYEVWPVPPPAAPTGLIAAAGDRLVALSWKASAWAKHYTIYRSNTSAGPYGVLTNLAETTFTDTGLTNGTRYYYVVAAVNDAGTSPNSSEVSAIPTGAPPPAAPTNLTASAPNGKRRIDLRWTQSSSTGVTQNRIYRSTTSGGYNLRATISAGTSFSDTSVSSRTTYYYVVTAVNGSSGKESASSNQASATVR